jgi:hypothetical protein
MKSKKKKTIPTHSTKRCPECFIALQIDAKTCYSCNAKIGKGTVDGRARKPIDWLSYIVSLTLFFIFFIYIWWAFF